jgi:hypothetical protein
MQGYIVRYHEDIGQGIIAAQDGRRFLFRGSEVLNPNGKLVGYDVDFVVESRVARDIIVLAGSPWSVFAVRAGSSA